MIVRSMFFKIIVASLIISAISTALHTTLQFLPPDFAIAYNIYVLIIIIGIAMFLAGNITDPLEKLRTGFYNLLEGNFVQVEIDTKDEFEDLGRFFNSVAKRLIEREKILRETEQKYRNLVENLNDWIFETDDKFNITFSNVKGYEIFRDEKIIGKNLREFLINIPEIDREAVSFETLTINGRIFEFSLSPIYKDENFLGYIGIGRDVTDRKKHEERTAHLAAITEHTIDAIVSLDLDGNILSWNKGAETMFGYKAEEMIGKNFTTLMPNGMTEQCSENFRRAVLEGYAKDIEAYRITKDGRIIVVDQTLTAIYDANGEITGFVAIMRDITEKKKNEEKLKKAYEELERKTSELKYLASIIENSYDAILSINMDGVITSWNKGAERLFGWKKEEAIGMHISKLLPDGYEREFDYILKKIRNGSQNISFEGKKVCRDGDVKDVEITASPIFENGGMAGISIIARDASHKIKSEQEILRRVLKYKVEIGRAYLTDNFDLALDVLRDTTKAGFSGIVISRRNLDGLKDCKILWLSEKNGKGTIQPRIDAIKNAIFNSGGKSVAVIELDYLITKLNFDSILEMIQQIREDFFILRRGIAIFVVNSKLLDDKQWELLKLECNLLQKKEIKLQPELYELLRFVYLKNKTGEKPSIKDTMEELNLARNTVKKRIKQLKSRGLVNVVKLGRTKLIEITDEGRLLFE